MKDSDLGRMKSINPREHWANKAADFTPWLAGGSNIALLAETLGLPGLTVEDTEVQVGPFRADILCREVGSEGYVLIENQLERTDHTHLGQILTYAAGLDAAKIIWISPRYTEEHRAALDWLNSITAENFHFFGVQLELWQIADSPLAPRFDLIAKPNDWTKQVRSNVGAGSPEARERAGIYMEWWSELFAYLEENNAGFTLGSGNVPSGNWVYVAGTPPYSRICVSYAIKQDTAKIFVLFRDQDGMKGPGARQWFEFARERMGDSLELGAEAQWVDDQDVGYLCFSKMLIEDKLGCFSWIKESVPRLKLSLSEFLKQHDGLFDLQM